MNVIVFNYGSSITVKYFQKFIGGSASSLINISPNSASGFEKVFIGAGYSSGVNN